MAKKITFQFTVTVADDMDEQKVVNYVNDAMAAGCEHEDRDSELALPGIMGNIEIVKTQTR